MAFSDLILLYFNRILHIHTIFLLSRIITFMIFSKFALPIIIYPIETIIKEEKLKNIFQIFVKINLHYQVIVKSEDPDD